MSHTASSSTGVLGIGFGIIVPIDILTNGGCNSFFSLGPEVRLISGAVERPGSFLTHHPEA